MRNLVVFAWNEWSPSRGIAGLLPWNTQSEKTLKPFITPWRAFFAYFVALFASILPLPLALLLLGLLKLGASGHAIASPTLYASGELLAFSLIGVVIFSIPIFPFYLIGIVIAKKLGRRDWPYFVMMGVAIAAVFFDGLTLLGHYRARSDIDITGLPVVILPFGSTGGFACWLCLSFLSRFGKQSAINGRKAN